MWRQLILLSGYRLLSSVARVGTRDQSLRDPVLISHKCYSIFRGGREHASRELDWAPFLRQAVSLSGVNQTFLLDNVLLRLHR
jgi:hypothetical protein